MAKIPAVRIELVRNTLYLKVTVPGTTKRKFKNLGHDVDAKQWDAKNEYVKKTHPQATKINGQAHAERDQLIGLFAADKDRGIVFTEAHIQKRLLFKDYDASQDFYGFCKEQIGIKDYSGETRRTYYTEVTKMEQFAPSLAFADITYSWIQQYENHMRIKLNNHDNTVWKSLKFINTMLNLAVKVGGFLDKNPFDNYDRGNYKQGIPVYLEWAEVMAFADAVKKKCVGKIQLIGYYALLSYYSGLRYSDCLAFDYEKRVIHQEKSMRLLLNTKKTGEIVSITFTKYIKDVVGFIKDKPLKITNQEFNEALKIIAGRASITKDVSSHTGRHSFAMRCAELHMSIDEVQKLLGHNKRSSTEIYFRIQNTRLDEAMKKWK